MFAVDKNALVMGRAHFGGCSHEDVGILFLQFTQHFVAVPRLREAAGEQLY